MRVQHSTCCHLNASVYPDRPLPFFVALCLGVRLCLAFALTGGLCGPSERLDFRTPVEKGSGSFGARPLFHLKAAERQAEVFLLQVAMLSRLKTEWLKLEPDSSLQPERVS